MNPNNLESSQSYHARGIFGHGRTEPDPEPRGFVCGLCQSEPVSDEDEYCPTCRTEEAEYRADQAEDR